MVVSVSVRGMKLAVVAEDLDSGHIDKLSHAGLNTGAGRFPEGDALDVRLPRSRQARPGLADRTPRPSERMLRKRSCDDLAAIGPFNTGDSAL